MNFLFHNAANDQADMIFLTPALGWMVGLMIYPLRRSQFSLHRYDGERRKNSNKHHRHSPQVTLVGGTELTFLLTVVTQSEGGEIEIPIFRR